MKSSPRQAICAEDIGVDLCVLVFHLFQRYPKSNLALKELCLRSQCALSEADLSTCAGVGTLHLTDWYATMTRRYSVATKQACDKRAEDVSEAEDLIRSLYPSGCSLSEYADAVQTCTAMLPFTIPAQSVDRFISQEGITLSAQKRHSLTVDELTQGLMSRLIVPSLLPQRWWTCLGDGMLACYQATQIGFSVQPLQIAIEYRDTHTAKMSTRVIPLQGHLVPNAPTTHLARRLAAVHGSLVSEDTLQKSLVTLQRLIQTDSAERNNAQANQPTSVSPIPPQPVVGPAEDTRSEASAGSSASSSEPQKADVGLLYRDPEKALRNVDLNDADDMTVKEFKEAMDVKFSSNLLRPGDEGYVYDRRVEFKPTKKSEWDDDSD